MKTQLNRLFAGLALTILPFLVLPAGAQSPTLGMTNDGTLGLSVFWPVADAGFSLQWTTSLGTPVAWQLYPAPPSLSGDGNNLLVALAEFQAANSTAFFQLVSNAVVVPAAPSVVTTAAAPVNTTTAALNGTVQPNTFDTTCWYQWGTDITYGQTALTSVVSGSNTAPVSVPVSLTGLAPATTYHFQLYGSNVDGISSGGDLTFTTAALLPDAIVQTFAASNITTTSAVLLGSMNPNGSDIAGWFEWGTTTSYGNRTVDFPFAYPGYEVADESDLITNLAPSTTYHYRIVAFNGGPTEALGNDVVFTTSTPFQQPPPIVTTGAANALSPTSETISGTINPNGATTTGLFVYNAAGGGTYTLSFPAGGDGSVHSFQTNLTGLTQNTTYSYTLVAYNSGGSSQGATLTFTTGSSQLPPTVTVGSATSVTATSATLNGTVNPNGAPTTCSFLYGTSPTSITTSLGTFSAGNDNSVHSFPTPLTGLNPNTTYYYIISATNSGGTSASAPATFTTGSAQQVPYVLTLAAGGITDNSATLNAFVNPNGADTHAYFLWGATTAYGKTNLFGDVGSSSLRQLIQSPISSLAPNTTYHYRIVAYNSAGTNNSGLDASFLTSPAGPNVGAALIPAGSFIMGDSLDGESDAIPTVSVYVSAFYMDTNLVTWSLWQSVYNYAAANGYGFNGGEYGWAPNHPVTDMDWYDAVKWCNARSQQAGLTPVYYTDAGLAQIYKIGELSGGTPYTIYANWSANGYRLPTEAEWEKAARGGFTGRRFPLGNTISESQANYQSAGTETYDLGPTGLNTTYGSGGAVNTSPVGSFSPNNYGLFDMAGNLYEYCWDWHAAPPYPAGSPYLGGSDPHGPTTTAPYFDKVVRGGDYDSDAGGLRCAARAHEGASNFSQEIYGYGFRCVRTH